MGAWAGGLMDNDDARDLADAFAATSDASLVEGALAEVLACGAGYLEAPCAQRGLAAQQSSLTRRSLVLHGPQR